MGTNANSCGILKTTYYTDAWCTRLSSTRKSRVSSMKNFGIDQCSKLGRNRMVYTYCNYKGLNALYFKRTMCNMKRERPYFKKLISEFGSCKYEYKGSFRKVT